jgi:hypothetical protein
MILQTVATTDDAPSHTHAALRAVVA